jgi:hypothetical protein
MVDPLLLKSFKLLEAVVEDNIMVVAVVLVDCNMPQHNLLV